MFSRQQVAALQDLGKQLEAKGVKVVVIGSSSPSQAKTFAEKSAFTGEIYVNEDLSAYRAFGLERGFFKTLGPKSIGLGIKAMGQGFRQGQNAGDLWQQGGLFVMGPGSRVAFQHVDRFAGDHADPDAVLRSCSI